MNSGRCRPFIASGMGESLGIRASGWWECWIKTFRTAYVTVENRVQYLKCSGIKYYSPSKCESLIRILSQFDVFEHITSLFILSLNFIGCSLQLMFSIGWITFISIPARERWHMSFSNGAHSTSTFMPKLVAIVDADSQFQTFPTFQSAFPEWNVTTGDKEFKLRAFGIARDRFTEGTKLLLGKP